MKDPAHHKQKTNKKVIREVRQEEEANTDNPGEHTPEPADENAGVEIEEQRTITRKPNRKFH